MPQRTFEEVGIRVIRQIQRTGLHRTANFRTNTDRTYVVWLIADLIKLQKLATIQVRLNVTITDRRIKNHNHGIGRIRLHRTEVHNLETILPPFATRVVVTCGVDITGINRHLITTNTTALFVNNLKSRSIGSSSESNGKGFLRPRPPIVNTCLRAYIKGFSAIKH